MKRRYHQAEAPSSRARVGPTLRLVVAAVLLASGARAQDGVLDSVFSTNGWTTVAFDRAPDRKDTPGAVSTDPSGRILVAGAARAGSGDILAATTRFRPDGTPDTTFNGDGKAAFAFHPDSNRSDARAILTRPDGKIWVVGTADIDATRYIAISRLTPEGLFDSSFGDAGTPGRVVRGTLNGGTVVDVAGAALQADGKIIVAGTGSTSQEDLFVARFTTAGALDGTFASVPGPGGVAWVHFGTEDYAVDLELDGLGRVILLARIFGGYAEYLDYDTVVVRLTSQGLLDGGFGSGSGWIVWELMDLFEDHYEEPTGLAVQPNHRILIVGSARPVNGGNDRVFAGRLLGDGSYDETLPVLLPDLNSVAPVEFGNDILVQSDRSLVLVADGGQNCLVARYDENGTALDASFGTDGVAKFRHPTQSTKCTRATLSGGRAVVAGTAQYSVTDYDFFVARLSSTLVFRDGFASGDTKQWQW